MHAWLQGVYKCPTVVLVPYVSNSIVRVTVLEVTVHVERQFTTCQSMLTHHIAGGPSMHMY